MSTQHSPESDKELWQSFASAPAVVPAAISDMDFAAWLEGGLTEQEAARIDAAVAASPQLRLAAIELADILGKPLPQPSPRIAVRAQALVGFPAEKPASGLSRLLGMLLPSFEGGFGLQRGVMAAAAVMVAAVGFMMGGGLGESYAQEKYASVQSKTTVSNPLGSDTSDQLNDLFTDTL